MLLRVGRGLPRAGSAMSLTPTEAYAVLDLDPGATLSEVRDAHRDLTQVWHPDRFAHSPRLQEKANRMLARINEARAVLAAHRPPSAAPLGPSARPGSRARAAGPGASRAPDLGPWASVGDDAHVVVGSRRDQAIVCTPGSPTAVARAAYRVSDEHCVSAVAHGPSGWLVVCSRWPAVGSQQFTRRSLETRVAWMQDHYAEGRSITALAEDDTGGCVVVMSDGLVAGSEQYRRVAAWPVEHARARRAAEGEAVSVLAASASGWHVVTAQVPGWGGQRLATRDSWEGLKRAIRKGWNEGRRITSLVWRQGTYGVVLTSETGIGDQTYRHTRTGSDLEASARAQWALGRVVTAACHDDDGWVLVWSERPGLG